MFHLLMFSALSCLLFLLQCASPVFSIADTTDSSLRAAATTTNSAAASSSKSITKPLETIGVAPGKGVKPGTELRILGVGDSITVGYRSDENGGDGNSYRGELLDDLSGMR
jgi:hypothetical protein